MAEAVPLHKTKIEFTHKTKIESTHKTEAVPLHKIRIAPFHKAGPGRLFEQARFATILSLWRI